MIKNVMFVWNEHFNDDGSEKIDPTPPEMPLEGFEATSSIDEKLKFMLERMMANKYPQKEELEDEFDFDLDDGTPRNQFIDDGITKADLEAFKNEQKKRFFARKKKTDDDDSVVRKSAKTDVDDSRLEKAKPKVARHKQIEIADDES